MAKIYIGVGHGGSDSGAVANGLKEKDLTLETSLACQAELNRHGQQTKISRTKDIDSTIASKVNECNSFKADYCVEIHYNAGGGDGCEVYHHHLLGKSAQLASKINEAIKGIGQNSRGLKVKISSSGLDYFGMIRNTNCPAVLVECAFIDSKDIQIADTKAEQQKMGVAIAHGVLNQLGVKILPVASASSTSTAKKENVSFPYKNNNHAEYTYQNTKDALSNKNSIGCLFAYETATAIGRLNSCPIVVYKTSSNYKVAFVKYEGGISAANAKKYVYNKISVGRYNEPFYQTTADCKAKNHTAGVIKKYTTIIILGTFDGCRAVAYPIDGKNYAVGFIR